MALLTGSQYIHSGLGPFDGKMLTDSYDKLLVADTFHGYAYNGMLVAVANRADTSKNGIYYFYDSKWNGRGALDVTVTNNWHKLGTLAEINAIADRVSALEAGGTGSGVDETAVNALIDARIDALKAEIAQAGYLTEADLEGYATETFVTNKIAEAQLAGEEVDLSGYATKDDLNDYAKTADIEANYATKNDVDASKIINISSIYELPNVGEVGYFYINETDGKTYIWDVENSKMVNFGIHSVKVIDGGDANSVYGA